LDTLISNNLKILLKGIIGFDYTVETKLEIIKESFNNFAWAIDFMLKFKT
jgi:hypothetical protein